jgi:hypothetical protein
MPGVCPGIHDRDSLTVFMDRRDKGGDDVSVD